MDFNEFEIFNVNELDFNHVLLSNVIEPSLCFYVSCVCSVVYCIHTLHFHSSFPIFLRVSLLCFPLELIILLQLNHMTIYDYGHIFGEQVH